MKRNSPGQDGHKLVSSSRLTAPRVLGVPGAALSGFTPDTGRLAEFAASDAETDSPLARLPGRIRDGKRAVRSTTPGDLRSSFAALRRTALFLRALYARLFTVRASHLRRRLQQDSHFHIMQQAGTIANAWHDRALGKAFATLRSMGCAGRKRQSVPAIPLLHLATGEVAATPQAARERWLEFFGAQELSALLGPQSASQYFEDRVPVLPPGTRLTSLHFLPGNGPFHPVKVVLLVRTPFRALSCVPLPARWHHWTIPWFLSHPRFVVTLVSGKAAC